MRACIVVLALTLGCGARAPTPPGAAAPMSNAPAPGTAVPGAAKVDKVFGKAAKGWSGVGAAARKEIESFGQKYLAFIDKARTPRRATDALVEGFVDGAHALDDPKAPKPAPGNRYYVRGPGEAAAFITIGSRPVEEGMRVVVAALDAPHIRLKQTPMYSEHNLAMLDTEVYGAPSMEAWLVTPLILDLFVARPGATAGNLALALGDEADEPVFVIPDLLPHLSQHVQKRAVVDSAERMDAVAGRSQEKLIALLESHGVSPRDFAVAEASLVPAHAPVWLGVDRGELGAYGHEHRALAFAAVETLARVEVPHRTSVVIVIGGQLAGYQGTASLPFVRRAMTQVVTALASEGEEADILTTRRVFARSSVLVAQSAKGKLGHGVSLAPDGHDAHPAATRQVLRAARYAQATYQVVDNSTWKDPARNLQTLDVNAVSVAIPVADRALPMQRISAFDLYQAHKLCKGWFSQP